MVAEENEAARVSTLAAEAGRGQNEIRKRA